MVVFCLVLSACSCQTSFAKATVPGVENQEVNVILIGPPPPSEKSTWAPKEPFKFYKEAGHNYEKLRGVLKKHCDLNLTDEKSVTAAVAIPLVVAGGKLLFELYMDKKIAKEERLKKAAQVDYERTVFVKEDQLQRCKCLLLTRYQKVQDKKEDASNASQGEAVAPNGLTAVFKMKKMGPQDLVMEPVYVRADNSVAIVNRDDPKISISFALALKTVVEQKGVPTLTAFGQGVVSVPQVKLDAGEKDAKVEGIYTDLIPVMTPPTEGGYISLSMGVTETGIVGVYFDQRIERLKAIRATMPTGFSESLVKLLEGYYAD